MPITSGLWEGNHKRIVGSCSSFSKRPPPQRNETGKERARHQMPFSGLYCIFHICIHYTQMHTSIHICLHMRIHKHTIMHIHSKTFKYAHTITYLCTLSDIHTLAHSYSYPLTHTHNKCIFYVFKELGRWLSHQSDCCTRMRA